MVAPIQSVSKAPTSSAVSSVAQAYTTFGLTARTKLIAVAVTSTQTGTTDTVATVKDGAGVNFNLVGRVSPGSPILLDVSLWELDTPDADVGTKPTITAALSGGTANMGLLLQEVPGLMPGTTAAIDGTLKSLSGSATGATGSPAYSSAVAGEYKVSIYGDDGGPITWTAPGGLTTDPASLNSQSFANIALAYGSSVGGAESGSWSLAGSAAEWGTLLVAFKLAPVTPYPVQASRARRSFYVRWGRGQVQPGVLFTAPPTPVPQPPAPATANRARRPFWARRGTGTVQPGAPRVAPPTPVPQPPFPAKASSYSRRPFWPRHGVPSVQRGAPAVPRIPQPPYPATANRARRPYWPRKGSGTVLPGAPFTLELITVTGVWGASYSTPFGFFFPFPSARPVQVPVANTPGDWMFAAVSWRQPVAGAGVTITVADDAHNYWEPLGAPGGDSAAAGVTRTAIWVAPAARAAQFVQAAATGPVIGLAVRILDVNGLQPWMQLTAITPGFANAATALSLAIGAPSTRAFVIAAAGSDNQADTVSGPGAGWTSLAPSFSGNGVDHTADIQVNTAWQVTTGAATAAWASTGSLDFSGVTAGVLVQAPAPAQPNPNWPIVITELAPGAGFMTPPSQITWVPLSARSLAMNVTQGRQYTLGQLQAAQGVLTIDNPDGALIPPGTGSFAGIDSGTPVRQRMIIPSLPSPYFVPFSGFFQRWPFQLEDNTLRGQTQATILDAWAYGAGTLDSMLREELKLDGPYALWMLDDPAGSTAASNLAPGNQNPLILTTSKLGSAGSVEAFGANSGALLGDTSAQVTTSGQGGGASGMWSQTLSGTSQQTNGYGYALVCADPNYPPIAAGVTIEGWFELSNPVAGFTAATSGSLFSASAAYANGTAITMSAASGFSFPGGFSQFTIYYVIAASGNNFQLAHTPGGTAITVTSAGAGFMIATTPWKSVIWSARNVAGPVVEIDVAPDNGNLLLLYKPQGGSQTTIVINSSTDFRSNGLTHVAVMFTQTTYEVIVNGGASTVTSGTFSAPLAASFTEMDIGGLMSGRTGGSVQGYAWTGALGAYAIYPSQLSQQRVLNHYWAAIAAMKGEAACDRIERILEYIGLTGRRCLLQQVIPEEGDLCVSGQDIGGQPAATSVTNIASSTLPAMMYVAPTGDLFYLSKFHAWNNPVRWVLGDNTAAGEIPFLVSMATDYDPSRIVNDIQLTQLDTSLITVPSAAALEAASRAQYGDIPYQQTQYLEFDGSSPYNAGSGLNDLGDWLAYAYAAPRQRIQSVTVEPASHPAAWAFAAGVSVGDMVTVNLRPPTAAGLVISVTARITQTTRNLQYSQDGVTGAVQCVLDYALEENCLTCDDPARGLLNGSNVLGW